MLLLAEYRLEPGPADLTLNSEAVSAPAVESNGSALSASNAFGRRADELCGARGEAGQESGCR